ncbi:MarR family winged helix-turn-helix transcriptional regulator [Variovorax sp. PBL-E5]|uniref:MarR family winged helix-turn-helix transcriptional regulator n=1 Tax=Variovorax sp. PBL-E5 TaxID=434014 RepID=UPI001318C5A5|nr:MarR family transcriptional regulator [Variovorax sp. PBL-E5]VTU45138.1 transcriptional regulator SlyA [Variovorax sp. PBL-E5]
MAKSKAARAEEQDPKEGAAPAASRIGHGGVISLDDYIAPSKLCMTQMEEYVGYMVRRLDNRIYRSFLDTLVHEEITPARFTALSIIGANPGVRQVDIARALNIARPAALKVVNLLVQLGLIECHPIPSDKRIGAIALTELGQRKLAVYAQKVREHEARVLEPLSQEERAQLMGFLQRVLA